MSRTLLGVLALGGIWALLQLHEGCARRADDGSRNGEAIVGSCTAADDDGNPCTLEGCAGGAEEHVARLGARCGAQDALVCDALGRCAGCKSDAECGEPTACVSWRCTNGYCEADAAAKGKDAESSPQYCVHATCNGMGGVELAPAPLDVPADECRTWTCEGLEARVVDAPEGKPCAQGVCDGHGQCVACAGSFLCLGTACAVGDQCASGHCVDGVCCDSKCDDPCMHCDATGACVELPAYEIDPDSSCSGDMVCAAGGSCKKADNEPCQTAGDCASGLCYDGICKRAVDAPCTQKSVCFTGFCRMDHRCGLAPASQPCERSDQCASGTCNPITHKCA
jgi:hypothetical protein